MLECKVAMPTSVVHGGKAIEIDWLPSWAVLVQVKINIGSLILCKFTGNRINLQTEMHL